MMFTHTNAYAYAYALNIYRYIKSKKKLIIRNFIEHTNRNPI